MSKEKDFLTKQEEQEVIEAILIAEKNTSGENSSSKKQLI
jgi:hypothetical protein